MGSLMAVLARRDRADPAVIRPMIAAAPHRGPLATSIELGDAVLAITESGYPGSTSSAAADGWAAVFSGALDNVDELVTDLDVDRSTEASHEPAAVALATYRRYGDDAPLHLRGAFAVIITDGSRLICFRDHLGYGTLYYRDEPGSFYAATEQKQVLAGAGVAREPDLEVLRELFYKTDHGPEPCPLRGVSRLPKASMIVADRDRIRQRRYWHPERLLETLTYSEHEVEERFGALMTRAVSRMMTGNDVISLSGGVDSPAVAAFGAPRHREMTGEPLAALSTVYPGLPSVDERKYIELVAGYLGLDPLHIYEQTARPLDDVEDWVSLVDGPVPTISLPQYKEHYEIARAFGYRNMLTGEVAELVFDMTMYRFPHLLLHGRFGPVRRDIAARRRRGASLSSIGRAFVSAFTPSAIARRRWRRNRDNVPDWVDLDMANEAAVRSVAPPRERWRAVQLAWLEPVGITVEADEVCQDLCGVRNRRPWTDVDLWEFFLSLPAEVKYPDGRSKTLVRRLLKGRLPDEILERRDKTAFDDSMLESIDYPGLRRWLSRPNHRVPGVRYDRLQDKLERQDLNVTDAMWAKDLASIHAFLGSW
jgi:asparagine synthase (glutamine-hydrolysing)